MKSSPGGMLSHADRGRPPKFLESTAFCFGQQDEWWSRGHTNWIVGKHFGGKEGVVFRKAAVVENQEKLNTALQRLQGMRYTSVRLISKIPCRHTRSKTYAGKNHTSPALKSSTKVCPSSFTASILTLPFST